MPMARTERIRRRLRLLTWVASCVCACFRTSSDPVCRHIRDACDLFSFQVALYSFRYSKHRCLVVMEPDGLSSNPSRLGETAQESAAHITSHVCSHSTSPKIQILVGG